MQFGSNGEKAENKSYGCKTSVELEEEFSLSGEKEKNYKSDTGDKTYLDQANDEYSPKL